MIMYLIILNKKMITNMIFFKVLSNFIKIMLIKICIWALFQAHLQFNLIIKMKGKINKYVLKKTIIRSKILLKFWMNFMDSKISDMVSWKQFKIF